MSRESDLQRKVVKLLRSRGAYAVVIRPPVAAGTPDVLACHLGRFWGIECKLDGAEPTPIQAEKLRQIEAAGGVAVTVRSVDDMLRALAACHSAETR